MKIEISDEKIIEVFLEIFKKDNNLLSEGEIVKILEIISKENNDYYIENLVFYMSDSLKSFIKKIAKSIENNSNGLDPFY